MRLASLQFSFLSTFSLKGGVFRTSLALLFTGAVISSASANEHFSSCTAALADRAKQEGVSQQIIDEIFPHLVHQDRVIELDRSQPEFVQTFPGYFSKRVTDWRTEKGKAMYAKHEKLLHKLSDKYGVPPHYLLAFWGLETNFGSYKGKMPVLDSLATLACDKRRSKYFTQEFLVAVKLMQREKLKKDNMVGSWAGAMGHTQFMPSAYTHYAIDGDGDGQVNLWESEEDALSSAANFLASLGWERSFRWGREVKLPEGFNYQESGYKNRKPLSEWHEQGVKKADGSPLGEGETTAYVIVPAGHNGPAFIAYKNFRVIMRWNNSEFYAIAVGVLADRIAGASGIKATLPDLPAYNRKDIIALQSKLNDLGFDVGKPDGIIGPATREGIRNYQISNNMIADGFPGLEVMAALNVELERDKASQS
ncbi:lytic murein transglycosylase [Alteromonas mediterranea]|jgi:peptidoglycan lytic transglycosylase B|uniref:Lytic transglycosylase n=2 Tax=Alteromonas mediterranea TaxID=314275 RepID=A0AAC8XH11_9ALTE|nr:lytic murein transglycosylase [Alteromonas mediterranea]AGP92211.1 membrane-bound lytic transglycosylase-like protein [Alteromonas mediterranea U8]MBR9785929.1 lytic murein transglycosylase [Gammaproteobacteria bacterium]AEA96626.1 lytic transglycosylase [Alteromonas mediterranea DE]AFV83954.1 membrane-bound lytic transglycosylase-like protein [Alteromonas mediterranea DE1]AGP80404.1 membrane-bound lytic transglycosylase-like protein [Alteromonas mediterranea MED64]|tara:strand:- start:547 stop:1812 length:1266 start_codon:yes stop_codon:yes gene_type:complete